METFADVLHGLIDHVLAGDLADKAHSIIDRASGTRTAQPAPPSVDAVMDPEMPPVSTAEPSTDDIQSVQ